MIELQDVTVCYEKHRRNPIPSLDRLSVRINKGEWVFLVGPSGAGKSTFLKVLYAGVRADLGKITLDGQDISRVHPKEIPGLRRKIGIVFQDFQLLAGKTAWENVAFALRVIGVPGDVIKREVPRALETVGIAHRAHAFPDELSGGEQQRVAIARAIVNDPLIILADEPTGNLDPETAQQIGALLRRISEERGTTIVMATHDRYLVDHMRRRVLRLRDGRLVSDENPGVYHPEDDQTQTAPPPVPSPEPEPEPEGIPEPEPVAAVPTPEPQLSLLDENFEAEPPVIEENPLVPQESLPEELVTPDSTPKITNLPTPDPRVVRALDNDAPIGSPENPIVQYDR